MEKYHQIILSFAIGLLIPMTVMNIGLKLTPKRETAPTPSSSYTESSQPAADSKIPILCADGQIEQMELAEEYLRTLYTLSVNTL